MGQNSTDVGNVLIEPPPPARRRRLRVANQLDEFEQLAGYLRGLKNSVMIGFEATGSYHRPLAYFLHYQGFDLRLIPTLALARTREAMHNSWDKNDPKDAQVILHLLKTGLTRPGTIQWSTGSMTCGNCPRRIAR
jgi:transposase